MILRQGESVSTRHHRKRPCLHVTHATSAVQVAKQEEVTAMRGRTKLSPMMWVRHRASGPRPSSPCLTCKHTLLRGVVGALNKLLVAMQVCRLVVGTACGPRVGMAARSGALIAQNAGIQLTRANPMTASGLRRSRGLLSTAGCFACPGVMFCDDACSLIGCSTEPISCDGTLPIEPCADGTLPVSAICSCPADGATLNIAEACEPERTQTCDDFIANTACDGVTSFGGGATISPGSAPRISWQALCEKCLAH